MNLEDIKEGDYLIYTERPYSDYADGLELIEASPEGLRARSVAHRGAEGGSFEMYTDPEPWLLSDYFDPKCWFPAINYLPGNCPVAYLLQWFKNHEITEAGVAVEHRARVPHSVIAYRWGVTNDHSYPVGAYPDFDTAKEAADIECEYRGGKYGVTVYVGGKAGDIRDNHRIVYHAPSRAGEESPKHEFVRDMADLIGSRVLYRHTKDESYEKIELHAREIAKHLKIDRVDQVVNPVAGILDDLISDMLYLRAELRRWYDERDRSIEDENPLHWVGVNQRIRILEGLRPKSTT